MVDRCQKALYLNRRFHICIQAKQVCRVILVLHFEHSIKITLVIAIDRFGGMIVHLKYEF